MTVASEVAVERTRDELHDDAKARLGVTGDDESVVTPPLRVVLREHGVSAYPLVALGVLAIVDTFSVFAFSVLAPEISATLGISAGSIAALLALKSLVLALGPLPMAALTQHRPRRAVIVVTTGLIWSVVGIATGFATAAVGLLVVLVVDGLTTASVLALHSPLLLDSYPPQGRVRVVSLYQGADWLGNVLAPLLVAGLAGAVGLTWRGIFVVLGVVSLGAALTTIRLRDPGFGRWDTERIRDAVREHDDHDVDALSAGDVALGFFEVLRRLLLIPTIRRLLAGYAVFGVLLLPLQTFIAFFLAERWGFGVVERGVFRAALAAVSIASLVAFAKRGEARFRHDPGRLVQLAAATLAVGVVFLAAAALAPAFGLMILAFAGAYAMLAITPAALNVPLLSVVPATMRPHLAGLSGLALGAGGVAGALFLGGIERRFGLGGTIVSLAVPGLASAYVIHGCGRFVSADLDRMIDETLEEEEIRRITSSGSRLPMLRCAGIDFAYGQVQVLFGVDFTVDDGEMVALLGTNGAGKSTLLRVISGLGLPTTGSVRFRGADITYLDAERRLHLGINQIPGGRAVFGRMSVVDNLRVYGYTIGRDRRSVDAAIERSFDAFPRLAERRNQKAATLSGGEQQMLGVSKALILRPRLLLIDELSLGLAPIVVGQLLDLVRQINADGTAVVLVEQSVNIALGLVDHAYFMEKGEMRFDGPSAELLDRGDLLRAVFLHGTAAAGPAKP